MDNEGHRTAVEAAYERLRETLEAKDVSVQGVKAAALDALNTARVLVQIDPDGPPMEGREPDDRHSSTEPDQHTKDNGKQL